MDDEEIAARFGEIIATERLGADPYYQKLVAEVNMACLRLFNHMHRMGHGDIDGIRTGVIDPGNKVRPLFKIERIIDDESDNQG